MKTHPLAYPNMRDELLEYLEDIKELSETEENKLDENFNYIIHFLYDDTCLAENSEKAIGIILENNDEANLIKNLIQKLNIAFDKYGKDIKCKELISKEIWKEILKISGNAKLFIEENNGK